MTSADCRGGVEGACCAGGDGGRPGERGSAGFTLVQAAAALSLQGLAGAGGSMDSCFGALAPQPIGGAVVATSGEAAAVNGG